MELFESIFHIKNECEREPIYLLQRRQVKIEIQDVLGLAIDFVENELVGCDHDRDSDVAVVNGSRAKHVKLAHYFLGFQLLDAAFDCRDRRLLNYTLHKNWFLLVQA